MFKNFANKNKCYGLSKNMKCNTKQWASEMKKYCLCKQYLQWSNIRIYDNTDIDDNVAFNLRLLEILSLKKFSFS